MRRDKKGRFLKVSRTGKYCLICGALFFVRLKRINAKFCSKKCQGKYYSGKNNYFYGKKIIHSPEMIQARRKKVLGKNNPNWKGGKSFENICKQCNKIFFTHPSRSRSLCSLSCRGDWQSENRRGENHSNWQGGITPEVLKRVNSKAWRILRREIYKRDNWTCQKCGKKNTRLNAHHIIPFQYSLCDKPFNLITLCQPCHAKEESLFKKENEELYCLLNQWKKVAKVHYDGKQMELF